MPTQDLTGLGDVELADAVRAGDVDAFTVLWERHAAAGRAAARRLTSTYDPDDVVQEAYLRVLRSLQLGSGPTGPFRPYLYSTLRTVVATWSRTPAPVPVDEVPDVADDTDVPAELLDRSMTVQAFRELPERWQSVLWYTEVESMGSREAGRLLGLTPGATAALAYRAREGLRRAWLQSHLNADAAAPGCRWTVERLGDHARGVLPRAARERVEEHLAGCVSCTALAEEVRDVASQLRLVLVPLVLGVPVALGVVGVPVPAAATSGSAAVTTSGSTVLATSASGVAALTSGAATAAVSSASVLVGVAGVLATPGALVAGLVAVAVAVSVGVVAVSQPAGTPDAPPAAVATAEPADRGAADGEPSVTLPAPPDVDVIEDGTPEAPAVGAPSPAPEPTTAPSPGSEPTAPVPVTPDAPAPSDEPAAQLTPAPEPAPEPPPVPGTSPEPDPSVPPEVPEAEPLVVTSAPRAGTLTVFPLVRGTGEPGALVRVTDGGGDVVASTTVGEDGAWEVAVTALAASGEHTLELVQETGSTTAAPATTLGPYVFDAPRVLSPVAGGVVVGQLESWSWEPPRLGTDVVLGGTPGLLVEAFVDGRSTGNLHTLADAPLVRRVRGLAPGEHTFGLRVVDPHAVGPGHGPTVTVAFTVVAP
ncbi:zf-HC2 domain-containing protein [Cellulosimicrobium sp. NPDC057127]|uniref:zf-HC2 domain-containing protein n=1 Tax=Cellulosimicrobium sp. NPDC057127 TaxID=3346026 RepID=UPI00363E20BB